MAIDSVQSNSTMEQFADVVNGLLDGVGDFDLQTFPDSSLIEAMNRLDSDYGVTGDAATLDGQLPSYYLNGDNMINIPQTTDSVTEGSNNLYYTQARVDSCIDSAVDKSFV